jgi:hypothetical protein
MARTYAPSPLRAIALAMMGARQGWKTVRKRRSAANLPPQIICSMLFGLGPAQRAGVLRQERRHDLDDVVDHADVALDVADGAAHAILA